jgi:hypothetical protein
MRRFAIVVALFLTGCIENAKVIPLDETAKAIGTPKFEIALHPSAHGGVGVTMPDGEILQGEYQILETSEVAMAASGQYVATGLPIGTHRVILNATGVRTVMKCDGMTNAEGHGSGLCATSTGAHYRVLF